VPAAIAAIADLDPGLSPVPPVPWVVLAVRASLARNAIAALERSAASTLARAEAAPSPMARDLELRCLADIEARLAEARAALAEYGPEGRG
jgi:hypothetical protein